MYEVHVTPEMDLAVRAFGACAEIATVSFPRKTGRHSSPVIFLRARSSVPVGVRVEQVLQALMSVKEYMLTWRQNADGDRLDATRAIAAQTLACAVPHASQEARSDAPRVLFPQAKSICGDETLCW